MRQLIAGAAALLLCSAAVHAQNAAAGERFVALAVDMGGMASGSASTVEIVINRWSTEGEATRLLDVLKTRGADELLDVLRDAPRVGFIRTPGNLAYDLRFARRVPGEDGGERIVLATDRPIGVWEAANRPRTIDYPFTVIEMRLDGDGHGEGKLSLATKVTLDPTGRTIELENYSTQPVQLRSVRREPTR